MLGGAISAYGDALQNAAQAWIVVQLTHSARSVALFALAWLLPRALGSLVAGVLNDRHRRSTVLKAAVLVGTFLSSLFLVAIATGHLGYRTLLVLALGLALTAPFEISARNSMLPTFVARDRIPDVVALNFFCMYLAELLGLLTAGILLSSVGAIGCVALNLVTYAVYVALVWPLKTASVARGQTTLRRAFMDGLRFVLGKQKALVPLLIGATFAVLGFHFDRSTLPLFAIENLHASPTMYGLLLAASPLGAVLMLGLVRPGVPHEMPGRIVASALMLGVGLGMLALCVHPLLAFAVLLTTGAARGVHYNSLATMLQMKIPDVMRGRVFSFFNIAGGLFGLGGAALNWMAPLVGAWLSLHASGLNKLPDPHGLRGALVIAAVACIACALACIRPLRRIAVHSNYMHTEDLAKLMAKLERGGTIPPRG